MAEVLALTQPLNLREVEVFRPYPDEFPDALLMGTAYERASEAEFVRIAKLKGAIVAAYAMDRDGPDRFVLHAVVVAPAWRKRGIGRWFVGHAIGVAESKGA